MLFFFTATATTPIYTLSLHDALPILNRERLADGRLHAEAVQHGSENVVVIEAVDRSEEHTSELQSLTNLVCRLLLEKKNKVSKHAFLHPKRGESRAGSMSGTSAEQQR